MGDSGMTRKQLACMIDHAVLAPQSGEAALEAGCELATRVQVACLCVKPCDVRYARNAMVGTGIAIGTVIGFPHGGQIASVKADEASRAIEHGADELDMVINIGALRDGLIDLVKEEIAEVVHAAGIWPVKVILECAYLDRERMAAGCAAAVDAGAAFVKTSTGFAPTGATVEDVRFLRQRVGRKFGVKAAGGIKTLAQAMAMIDAGANRIGTSATEAILNELPE